MAGGGKFANGAVTGAFAYLISPTGSASEQSVDAGTSGRESAVAQPRYASADTMMAQQEDDVALAFDSNSQRRPSFGQCLTTCAADQYGAADILERAGAGATSIPFPKSWIGAPTVMGASPFTNSERLRIFEPINGC